MPRFGRILAPTDFSSVSFRAADYAVALANRYDAALEMLHVVPDTMDAGGRDKASREAWDRLDAFVALTRNEGVSTTMRVEVGSPAKKILEVAAEGEVDLICVGTHGRQGVERLALGSISEAVLRDAKAPVLTVSEAGEEKSVQPADFSNILCAVDFAESSLKALDYAKELARDNGRSLTVLSVVEWLSEEPDDDDPDLSRFRARMCDSVRERLDQMVSDDARSNGSITTVVRVGKPYREILALSEAISSELIVMGVRGRNPIDLLLFGSTTNQTVRRAKCAVLTIGGA